MSNHHHPGGLPPHTLEKEKHMHDTDDTPDPYETNTAALRARNAALIAEDLATAPVEVPCVIAPGTDSLAVWRNGGRGSAATTVAVGVACESGRLVAHLSPSHARMTAMTLLQRADEADGIVTDFKMVAAPKETGA